MDLRTFRSPGGPAGALWRPTDRARLALRLAEVALAAFAVLTAAAVGVGTALTRPTTVADPRLAGLVAGVVTLAVCWGLLAIGVTWWSRRLSAIDRRQWTRGWALVEPVWSRRG